MSTHPVVKKVLQSNLRKKKPSFDRKMNRKHISLYKEKMEKW